MGSASVSGYAVSEDLLPYLRNWQSPRGSQLPVCPSTADNRDLGRTGLLRLALNPSKWFVNSGRQGFSNQELGELRMDRRGYGNSSEAIPFLLSYRIDMLSRLKKRGVKTLEIEPVQTRELAYGVSGSR
jgi:hypothetical protein